MIYKIYILREAYVPSQRDAIFVHRLVSPPRAESLYFRFICFSHEDHSLKFLSFAYVSLDVNTLH